jgi:hypothetical protein
MTQNKLQDWKGTTWNCNNFDKQMENIQENTNKDGISF